MTKMQVALSSDFKLADGSPAFPSFDLTPLDDDPNIEWRYVEAVDGTIPAKALEDMDALILLTPRFDAASVPASDRLALVARFGVGYDTVDVPVCTRHDIALAITPDGVRRPVAVAIMTFILALAGKLVVKDALVRRGPDGWAERSANMGIGLVGKTLGQLGIGNIGAEVFRLAAAFDMRFIAYDPFADSKTAAELGVELVGLDELFAQSDFLSISCPLNEQTRGIVNAERLALMKPTSFVINTARGPVVDQNALYEALKSQQIAGAGIDVFEVEPTPLGEPITKLDNVLLAPHALCWTDECFAGIGAADIKAVQSVMRGEVPRGLVNSEIANSPGWQAKLARLGKQFAGR